MLPVKACSNKFDAVSSIFDTRQLQLFVQMPLYKHWIAIIKALAICKNKRKCVFFLFFFLLFVYLIEIISVLFFATVYRIYLPVPPLPLFFSTNALQVKWNRAISMFRYLRCPMNRLWANKNLGDVLTTLLLVLQKLLSSSGNPIWLFWSLCWAADLYLLKEGNELPGFLWKKYAQGIDGLWWEFCVNVWMEKNEQAHTIDGWSDIFAVMTGFSIHV